MSVRRYILIILQVDLQSQRHNIPFASLLIPALPTKFLILPRHFYPLPRLCDHLQTCAGRRSCAGVWCPRSLGTGVGNWPASAGMIKSWTIYLFFFFFGGVHAGTLDIYIENISITVYIIDINWIINNTNQTKSPCWAQEEKNNVPCQSNLWSSQLPGWRQSGWAGQGSRGKALNRYPPKQWSMAHLGKVCWNMLLLYYDSRVLCHNMSSWLHNHPSWSNNSRSKEARSFITNKQATASVFQIGPSQYPQFLHCSCALESP